MKKIVKSAILGLPVALLLAGCGKYASVSYEKDIRPIIDKHCVECHLNGGQGHVASGFLIESYDSLMKGTKFGPVVVAGDPLSSSLYRLVAGEVDKSIQMPHGKDPISDKEIETIERWIAQGAKNN
ncbi:c-type cytochrome domain-containing protein [Thiocystis violascens]|uniref:Planctomycete cytochrome C n=1 Tax=Thiocystis violascens (strain ATCC 17096 / DSM 198 / 6111) TaxID=765911 RepID=I3YCG0_THIV6|nr:c-type cytochrome domain-containing protein [Thiocystis violascens]AFL74678.1 Planctomycete cytochrome C [Thiocystis violascens DSM 198]